MKIDYQAIYEKLAKQNGVTPQQVREDMAQAIRQAYENPKDEQTKIKPSSLAKIKKVGAFGTHLFMLGNNCKFFWLTFLFF